jgi:CheY-like chemotaxis protein
VTVASDVVDLIVGLAWPLVVAVVILALYPTVRRVMESRAFTVRVGGAEITVQHASDQLGAGLEDVREQVAVLSERIAAMENGSAPERLAAFRDAPEPAGDRTLLWVDDHPENNAYEVAALQRKGVRVTQCASTAEAGQALSAHGEFSAIVSDMGRVEDGAFHPDAGVELIDLVRAQGAQSPVLIYTSAPTLSRTRERALEAGAAEATASATQLLHLLAQHGVT